MNNWDLIIALFVAAIAGSVAYLCYFALRLWNGHWKKLAMAPLILLAVWLLSLVVGASTGLALRALWPFELLLWAMATTIYLVVLFTARRTFQKADAASREAP